MTLTTNREPTNEIASKKIIPDANLKGFTREQAQTFISINTNFDPNNKIHHFGCEYQKMEKKIQLPIPPLGS